MERVIAIVGATATGKSDLAIALAEQLPIEIISGDSMMIYRGMDIGTAKPTPAERAGVPHHMIDIREPWQEFAVVEFIAETRRLISTISARGNLPVIVGGTGLYIKALLEEYHFSPAPKDAELRQHLQFICERREAGFGHRWLQALNPAAAKRLHPNDEQRIVRALEVYLLSGTDVSGDSEGKSASPYDALVIGLQMERGELYQRINNRVSNMVEQGLLNEINILRSQGMTREHQAMKGIGYKELLHVDTEEDLRIALEKVKQHTRNYAKRQITWFNRMPYIRWVDVSRSEKDSLVQQCFEWIFQRWGDIREKGVR